MDALFIYSFFLKARIASPGLIEKSVLQNLSASMRAAGTAQAASPQTPAQPPLYALFVPRLRVAFAPLVLVRTPVLLLSPCVRVSLWCIICCRKRGRFLLFLWYLAGFPPSPRLSQRGGEREREGKHLACGKNPSKINLPVLTPTITIVITDTRDGLSSTRLPTCRALSSVVVVVVHRRPPPWGGSRTLSHLRPAAGVVSTRAKRCHGTQSL